MADNEQTTQKAVRRETPMGGDQERKQAKHTYTSPRAETRPTDRPTNKPSKIEQPQNCWTFRTRHATERAKLISHVTVAHLATRPETTIDWFTEAITRTSFVKQQQTHDQVRTNYCSVHCYATQPQARKYTIKRYAPINVVTLVLDLGSWSIYLFNS